MLTLPTRKKRTVSTLSLKPNLLRFCISMILNSNRTETRRTSCNHADCNDYKSLRSSSLRSKLFNITFIIEPSFQVVFHIIAQEFQKCKNKFSFLTSCRVNIISQFFQNPKHYGLMKNENHSDKLKFSCVRQNWNWLLSYIVKFELCNHTIMVTSRKSIF